MGNPNSCAPTVADNVIFDDRSFSSSSNGLSITGNAYCKSFICSDDLAINGNGQLNVTGDFNLDTLMSNFNFNGRILFNGDGNNKLIQEVTQHHPYLNLMVIMGLGSFDNNLHLLQINFYIWKFNFNDKTITLSIAFESLSSTPRTLDIRNSQINVLCNGYYSWNYGFPWSFFFK